MRIIYRSTFRGRSIYSCMVSVLKTCTCHNICEMVCDKWQTTNFPGMLNQGWQFLELAQHSTDGCMNKRGKELCLQHIFLTHTFLVPDPLHVHCDKGCQLSENGTNSFYELLLNGTKFLRFHVTRNYWMPLQDTSATMFISRKLNEYNETTTDLQFFLQKTCINFIREHTDLQGPLTGM